MKGLVDSAAFETALRDADDDCLLDVRVTPRASTTEILGVAEGRLRVRLQAPPVEGAANEALTEFIARVCGVPKSSVRVERGDTGRAKTIRIRGVSRAVVGLKLSKRSK